MTRSKAVSALRLLCLSLAVLSAVLSAREWRVAADPATPTGLAWSTAGASAQLDRCLADLAGLSYRLSTSVEQSTTETRCGALAERALQRAPGWSVAYLTRAAAHREGDPLVFADALQMSQATSPREGWLAQRRFVLSARTGIDYDALDPDIAVLMSSHRYRHTIVAAFGAGTMANRILFVAEQSPAGTAKPFLDDVDAWTRRHGS